MNDWLGNYMVYLKNIHSYAYKIGNDKNWGFVEKPTIYALLAH